MISHPLEGHAFAVFGDLTVPDQVDRLVRDSKAAAGSIDILVNNVCFGVQIWL
ncbi:hypothetical protein [Rhizobium leguminosarum]|uniref:hypothetical protein n=1 Tax=Rhizobium leguminosarum TaxID=384 RepID=UPI001FED918D|nr:hypothetical protein [Rhizobium leguminosarum]